MPHKLRKIRKTRGSRTQGYGRIGQHRDAGSKGYRKRGRHKNLWSYVTTYEPDYFNKTGFTSPQSLHRKVNVLNLKQLEQIAEAVGQTQLDLTAMGFTKLLGAGKITRSLTVTIPSASKSAAEKIVGASGKLITEQEQEAKAAES